MSTLAAPRGIAPKVVNCLLVFAVFGCGVPRAQYDSALADQAKARQELAAAQKRVAELLVKVQELKGKQSKAYAAICEKYAAMGGSSGALGPLQAGADDAGGAKLDFAHGLIAAHHVGSGTYEAHEVHGVIYDAYKTVTAQGSASSLLGVPLSDEEAWETECAGGRRNRFEHGSLVWCPGWKAADPRQ